MKEPVAMIICVLGLMSLVHGPFAQEKTKPETPPTGEPTSARKNTIRVAQIDSFYYASVEMTGGYDQHDTAFNILYTEASRQDLPMGHAPLGIYWNDPDSTPTRDLRWEVGLVVPKGTKVKEPLKLKKWEFTRVATRTYSGPFESAEADRARTEIFAWIEERGYVVSGPVLEMFLTIPRTNAKGQRVGTVEFLVPVKKPE